MSHRQKQIESTMRRAVSTVLARDVQDPRIGGLISVTRVQVSPDLYNATVFISVMPATAQAKAMAALKHGAGFIQSQVGKSLTMKRTPRIEFRLDQTLKKQADVFSDIHRGLNRETPSADAQDEASNAQDNPT